MLKRFFCLLAATAALAGCGPKEATTASQSASDAATDSAHAGGIAWFDGSVDEAFAYAANSGKPIFLYWGAEWCPPCHAVKATVFTRPEFIERSKLFVPVYLDGDQPNAQALGEKFGVFGYPTMIVFDSNGVELTRIPGGIDIEAYAGVLDLTLNAVSPVSELVDGVLDEEAELSAADCRLLAYHSWEQDTTVLAERDEPEAFRDLFDACPADLAAERSILYLAWLDSALDAAGENEPLTVEQVREARERLYYVLGDPQLVRANIFALLFDGSRFTAALTEADTGEREALARTFSEVYDAIAGDDSVYLRERIYTLIGRIGFERIDDEDAPVSGELRQEIRDMASRADQATQGAFERHPIVNALANVYEEAGMDDDAKTLLLAELDRSGQPYYFMLHLADIEQRAGNTDAAIDWLQKAYDGTRGPATRFQWGYYYLQGLLEMAPADTQRIQDTAVAMMTELLASGGIHQRPKAQLARLEESLLEWGAEHAAALNELRESVHAVCAGSSAGDEACGAFLGSA